MTFGNWFSNHSAHHPLVEQFKQVPLPPQHSKTRDCSFLVLDLELTGLNPKKDHIVSIGWLPIRQREVIVAEAQYHLIKSPVSVGQSAVIHGLHDRHLHKARALMDVLAELLAVAGGSILVAHHARLDKQALSSALRQNFGQAPKLRFIDTLRIEQRRLARRETPLTTDALQLPACLNRHGLPRGTVHHALEDAYGCALLFLAQLAAAGRSDISLAELQRLSR